MLREGYLFGLREAARAGDPDAVPVRVGGRRYVLLRGAAGAELFYDTSVMVRRRAVPARVRSVLFGRGAVHGLDGEAHHHRKAMFLDVLARDRVRDLEGMVRAEWSRVVQRLDDDERAGTELFALASEVLCRTVCAWAGVPLADRDAAPTATMLRELVEGATGVGPRHWRGRVARLRADRWAAGLVRDVRSGRLEAPAGSALAVVAAHRRPDGSPLPAHTAGVELLNVVRPAVAVDRLVVFAAMALDEQPAWRERLRASGTQRDRDLEHFVLEVRRRTPFVPALAARPERALRFRDVEVPARRRVLLDVFGTDHDERAWPDPFRFDPYRFVDRAPGAFDLVPQGGGDAATGHRCPGEWATEALLRGSVAALVSDLAYEVPEQDLSVSPVRFLGLPRSRFRVRGLSVAPPGAVAAQQV